MAQYVEHDWVERAKRGEPAAVAELYRRYWRAARATAYGVTGNLASAEDAASEAFCAALDGLSQLRDVERFGPWLRTIVVRTARRLKSAATKNTAATRACEEGQLQTPGMGLEQQEAAALVHQAVRSLPQMLREVISLFYFEGYAVEEIARFLDAPAGTVKRRLHDGRQRLRTAAEQIMHGSKPMNEQQAKILQQLREAAEQGLDSEAFYQTIRQATRLGPVPRELLQDILKRRLPAGEGPLIPPEKEHTLRNTLQRMHEPSERARDASHPVGAAAGAIREALPEFQSWQVDMSKVDLNETARRFRDHRAKALSYLLPPGFAESPSGAYITAERGLLIEDTDGSVLTMGELMERKTTQEAFRQGMKEASRSSDVLGLVWKQPEPLELRAIEGLLRDLSAKIVPDAPVRFLPYREPRFRAALRMQLGDSPIPAAIGGVLNYPSMPSEEVHVASVAIYLEPWAAARSGQPIPLEADSPFPSCQPQGRIEPVE